MKYKCLFLQGDSQIGKSTLILESILPFLPVITGFLSQRLIKYGQTKAFCLTPIELAASSLVMYDAGIPNIFLENTLGKWQKNEEVFRTYGVKLLSNLTGKQLVVLDEIGGMELLVEPFREKLYEVLSSDIPCIGVIKSHKNKSTMNKSVDLEEKYTVLYEKLYSDIEKTFDGIIIDANVNSIGFLKKSIRTFLNDSIKMI